MAGDRISARSRPGMQAAGAALYLLGPITPMVFMGEEWAASHAVAVLHRASTTTALADAVRARPAGRVRRRTAGREDAVPDPQDPATRDASVLDWAEARRRPTTRGCCSWYAACTGLRRELLGDGPTRFADVAVDPRRGRPVAGR